MLLTAEGRYGLGLDIQMDVNGALKKALEQIPEKFLDEHGELNTSALVKSYCELEKKMSSMVSIPNEESDEGAKQKFNHAIGVPDKADEYDSNTKAYKEKLNELDKKYPMYDFKNNKGLI